MKNLIVTCFLALVLFSCHETCIEPTVCTTPATVRDLTGLDGCGWIFELQDGKQLVATHAVMFCGTSPLPKEITEDPLYNFELVNGKTVSISYEEVDAASSCMVGPLVKITCISERVVDTNE